MTIPPGLAILPDTTATGAVAATAADRAVGNSSSVTLLGGEFAALLAAALGVAGDGIASAPVPGRPRRTTADQPLAAIEAPLDGGNAEDSPGRTIDPAPALPSSLGSTVPLPWPGRACLEKASELAPIVRSAGAPPGVPIPPPIEDRASGHTGVVAEAQPATDDDSSKRLPRVEPGLASDTDPRSAPLAGPNVPPTAVLNAVHAANDPPISSIVDRDLRSLEPEFRMRLEHLIHRMRREYGYQVTVVETFRSQDRQDALYRQGRSSPGPIVTWTQASNHTLGRAADVAIRGGDALAFARLRTLASEVGLRTLGSLDPGHLEPTTPAVPVEALQAIDPSTPEARGPRPTSGPNRTALTAVAAGFRQIAGVPENAGDGPVNPDATGDRPSPLFVAEASDPARPISTTSKTEGGGAPRIAVLPSPHPSSHTAFVVDRETSEPPSTVAREASVAVTAIAAETIGPSESPDVRRTRPAEPSALTRNGPTNPEDGSVSPRQAGVLPALRLATPAAVATVATVARVAQVATPARMARADGAASNSGSVGTDARGIGRALPPTGHPAAVASKASSPSGDDGKTGDRDALRPRLPRPNDESTRDVAVHAAADEDLIMINRTKPSAEDAVRASAAPSESGIAARIAQLDDLRDSVAERPMSGMLLRMTAPDGSEDLIRVSVRGHSVDATVDVRDSTTASLLSRQVNELSQALERHGLDAERLVIRTVRSNDPGLTAGTSAAPPDRDSLRMTGSARSGDGDSPTDRHGTRQQQQSHDPSRQRTRRGFRGTP